MGDAEEVKEGPLGETDALFKGAADAIGAETPASVSAGLDDEQRKAIEVCMRLVAGAGLDHTLTRNGQVLVPVEDDGRRTVVVEPITLNRQEWINIWIPLLELPDPSADAERLSVFLVDANRYYGAKFLNVGAGIVVMLDLPCEALTTPTLVAAMERVAWVADDVQPDLSALGTGRPAESAWQAIRFPINRPLKTPQTTS